jgi:hypothetical protein
MAIAGSTFAAAQISSVLSAVVRVLAWRLGPTWPERGLPPGCA